MSKTTITGIIAAVVIIGGGAIWYFSHGNSANNSPIPVSDQVATSTGANSTNTTSTAAPSEPIIPGQAPAISASTSASVTVVTNPTPAPKSFSVNGNDESADLTSITVAKGTPVTITFGADAQGTYHGGLDFRSSVVNTGPIAPGSTKTVTFTAESSFNFTPYWPSTNIAKPYVIKIIVQ